MCKKGDFDKIKDEFVHGLRKDDISLRKDDIELRRRPQEKATLSNEKKTLKKKLNSS